MTDLVVLGTDTDAGKTTFAVLWLAAFADAYEYWKPLTSGTSDVERVRELVPPVVVHGAVRHFEEAVAPLLGARRAGAVIPAASELAGERPHTRAALLIETFGSPFSPLNETELQIRLIQALGCRSVLISPSAVGAIGRTLQCLQALAGEGISPRAVVLIGSHDPFAIEQISRHADGMSVFSLLPPQVWDTAGVAQAASEQREVLEQLREHVFGDVPSADRIDILERDRRFVWHPYTSLRETEPPLVVTHAQDEFLYLADGRRVIDGISSWWTILHGHRHPVLLQALRAAASRLDHVHFAGVTHPAAVELAERILQSAPWTGGRVFYSDNGSTAVEVALKLAYQYWCHRGEPERTLFIGFEGGYHGDTFGAMAVGRDPVFFGRFEPLLFRALTVPLSADALQEALRSHRGKVAAVILEPLVQGAGGMRMHSPELLRDLLAVTQERKSLFIADEVMTGGGRTGTLWAHQAAPIAPDLICAAKTLAGGMMPLAATLAAPQIVSAWDTADRTRTFFHGHSFTAHPLACAVAVASWKLLTQQPLMQPQRVEAIWKDALLSLREHPGVRDVRVRGSVAAVEIAAEGGYLAEVGRVLRAEALGHGVLLRPLGNVLYALPPFCASEASLRQIAAALRAAAVRAAAHP